jgi:hypothetical protein
VNNQTSLININIPNSEKCIITNACVNLCIKDLRPFDVVEDEGFMELASCLINLGAKYDNVEAKQILPHSTTVSRNIHKIEKENRQELINKLKPLLTSLYPPISYTCDL